MYSLRALSLGRAAALLLLCWLGMAVAGAQPDQPYALPLAGATEWEVLVFGARAPQSAEAKLLPFTVKATWEGPGGPGSRELTGEVARLRVARLPLSLPDQCESLRVTLDWQSPGVDLDLGLECPARRLHLAPVLTVLKPEVVRLDAQTAPFYQWLSQQHPEWWRGYPFWAEIRPAPRSAPKESR